MLDIGAGDLRLTRQIARIARQVYALECQPDLLANQLPLPANLTVICADARNIPWPPNITVGVLMMRHCTHVAEYVTRLRQMGCNRLITNARWGMSVEQMDLQPQQPWETVKTGWYACLCGKVGFNPGPIEAVNDETLTEVENRPACR